MASELNDVVSEDQILHFHGCRADELQVWISSQLTAQIAIKPKSSPLESDIMIKNVSNAKLIKSQFTNNCDFDYSLCGDRLVLYYNKIGKSRFIYKKHAFDLRGGDAFVLSKYQGDLNASVEGVGLTFSVAYSEVVQILERYFERPVSRDLDLCCAISADTAGAPATLALISAMESCVFVQGNAFVPTPHAERLKRDALIMLILECFPHRYTHWFEHQGAAASPGELGRAIEFIDDSLSASLTVDDIAREVGISVRALQRGFRRYRGTSPQMFLKRAKLAQVRRELLDPSSIRSIEEIASQWGFTNRGHFALDYFRAFGERPSQTRRSR